jgi:5-hydroxyisourate hydrolase
MSRSPITTHVLDTAAGVPAKGIKITCAQLQDGDFVDVASGVTDADGRIADLLEPGTLASGTYRMTFEVGAYHERHGMKGFYPEVSVVFAIEDTDEHYHVPLLLSPFGYSTYRGS